MNPTREEKTSAECRRTTKTKLHFWKTYVAQGGRFWSHSKVALGKSWYGNEAFRFRTSHSSQLSLTFISIFLSTRDIIKSSIPQRGPLHIHIHKIHIRESEPFKHFKNPKTTRLKKDGCGTPPTNRGPRRILIFTHTPPKTRDMPSTP